MTSLLHLVNVGKCYMMGSACEIVPVREVSVEIARGERIGLLGKSGSGKTTLLNLVGGVDTPSSGRIYFNGRDLGALSPPELADYRRREVGFVFQSFNLFPTLTVGENVMLPLDLLGIGDERRARDMLTAVGLDGHWAKFPEQLSGGEQQRVAIARALVKSPSLILADEPTGNLDLETSNQVLRIIDEVCRDRDATLIMATHSLESLWLADRTFRLQAGALIEESSSASPRTAVARQSGE